MTAPTTPPTTGPSIPAARTEQVPIGTGKAGTRTETDSLGAVDVPAEHYWGRRPSVR